MTHEARPGAETIPEPVIVMAGAIEAMTGAKGAIGELSIEELEVAWRGIFGELEKIRQSPSDQHDDSREARQHGLTVTGGFVSMMLNYKQPGRVDQLFAEATQGYPPAEKMSTWMPLGRSAPPPMYVKLINWDDPKL